MKSIFNGAGHFFNDDTASGGKFDEDDTLACGHCDRGLLKSKWKESGGMCFVCSKPLCRGCVDRTRQHGCEGPATKRLEAAVNDQYRREQNAKILGI
jgi:hypothetical protein